MIMIWTNRRAFHQGRIILLPSHFLSFLLLYLTNISSLFPSRCRDTEQWKGRKRMRILCPYLTSAYVAYTKAQGGAARDGAVCHGATMEGWLAPQPCPHRVAGEQGQGRRGEGLWSGGGCSCSSPGSTSLVRGGGGGEPLSNPVGRGWTCGHPPLLESAWWAGDLGRGMWMLPPKCVVSIKNSKAKPSWVMKVFLKIAIS